MKATWIKPIFIIAGLYDGILGVAFLFFPVTIFETYNITPPNHVGYVQFPALLLLIFAAMFFRIASDPIRQRELIPYGIALKLAYSGSVFGHQLAGGIPSMWIPWAWADLLFLVLFILAWNGTAKKAKFSPKRKRQ